MEERFKKRLQDDISHHFSHQSLILSILLIGLFLIFSLAPQQIGLYQDLKAVEHSYHQLIRQNKALLTELNQHILTKDRKSTRLNSSHANISYAVFCLTRKRANIAI